MEGIIIKNQSNDYTVRTSNGLYVCKPRGKFRNDKITPLVGDSVIIDDINNYLLEILPRKNSLIRPPIANIDIALIAVSVKEPNFDSNLLDKLLTIISFNNIEPVICLTKLDLLTEEERNEISKALGRGKHTTRCVTLYEVDGALIADTPGFSSVDFRGMTKLDIRDNMKEMFDGLHYCKYRDCMHIKEDGCYIKETLEKGNILPSRYNNYKSFIGGK